MTECNSVTKLKKVGGRRRISIYLDPSKEVTETMIVLAQLKNEGRSWRSLAAEVNDRVTGDPVTHTLIRNVTLGLCKSPKIDYALGIRQAPPPIEVTPCPDCGKVHQQRKACKPTRKRGKRKLVFELDDDDFERSRAVVNSHPGGRNVWLREHTQQE